MRIASVVLLPHSTKSFCDKKTFHQGDRYNALNNVSDRVREKRAQLFQGTLWDSQHQMTGMYHQTFAIFFSEGQTKLVFFF